MKAGQATPVGSSKSRMHRSTRSNRATKSMLDVEREAIERIKQRKDREITLIIERELLEDEISITKERKD